MLTAPASVAPSAATQAAAPAWVTKGPEDGASPTLASGPGESSSIWAAVARPSFVYAVVLTWTWTDPADPPAPFCGGREARPDPVRVWLTTTAPARASTATPAAATPTIGQRRRTNGTSVRSPRDSSSA